MEQKMTSNGGLSKARLGRMHGIMATHVESGEVPGLVTLVSRDGEIHVDVIGSIAIDGAPMQRDTIFRITSMTKPVTAVAAMILVEESCFRIAIQSRKPSPRPASHRGRYFQRFRRTN